MLKTLPGVADASALDDGPTHAPRRLAQPSSRQLSSRWRSLLAGAGEEQGPAPAEAADRTVARIFPIETVRRHKLTGRSITAELVQWTGQDRIECRYNAASDLLVAYDRGARREGETAVNGEPRSSLRDPTRRLTFVPAGHDYFEWHEPRTPARLILLYLESAGLDAAPDPQSAPGVAGPPAPRVHFEDETLWGTVLKLRGLLEGRAPASAAYLDALGAVLAHELLRLDCEPGAAPDAGARAKGGLAAWQQRAVATYIEEHLAEPISLATLAQLARLSPYHFSRAFKQSFGVPPHRYHTTRRIEHAKALLERRALSVTDVGLALGFSETSSFTAAFRRTTGLTPSRYHRSIG